MKYKLTPLIAIDACTNNLHMLLTKSWVNQCHHGVIYKMLECRDSSVSEFLGNFPRLIDFYKAQ